MANAWEQLVALMNTDAAGFIGSNAALAPATDLYHDLDMSPESIRRLILMWAARFAVDISTFDIDFYYPSARLGTGAFVATLVRSPFSAKARHTLGGRALTLGMLADAMRGGRWEA
ncbi:DUF1493 family protein [Burkholderia gladioli]|uniref:DUF1493 family protein n=2 Tax=Burkholderiaceae TaxID=119060 RepID=UPI0016416402|nr:DUF1493 family protein [Burkholderia gladioli]